jgi:hypothetical protein
MSAQIGPIPVQTVDKKQYNACRGKNDMQDEKSCDLLKGTDYQLRTGAKRGGIREDIREPLQSYHLRIRGRDAEVRQAFDPLRQVDPGGFLATKEFLQVVHRTSPGFCSRSIKQAGDEILSIPLLADIVAEVG